MTATAKRTARKPITRTAMLDELEPKTRRIVERADQKTRSFLLDAFRFGKAGLFK